MSEIKEVITCELLTEVLKKEVSRFCIIGKKVEYVVPDYESEEDGELVWINLCSNINIHELADKIIDWLEEKGHYIIKPSEYIYELVYHNQVRYSIETKDRKKVPFMCGQWIIEREGNKDD